jgi:RNA polymerase sigma factor (sigma-70 family)
VDSSDDELSQLNEVVQGSWIASLAPRERVAVVLKDVFGLSLQEIAEALSTSEGAIKAALHRGRGKLQEHSEDSPRAITSCACGSTSSPKTCSQKYAAS